MSSATWTSAPIQLTETIHIDVSASAEGVVLGESANHTLAADLLLKPAAARALAIALLTGADEAEKAARKQP